MHLSEEASYNIHAVAYVECLQKLRDLKNKKASMTVRFLACDSDPSDHSKQVAATRKLERECRWVVEQLERVNLDICALEVKLAIERSSR